MLSYASRKNVIEGNLGQSSPKFDEYITGFNGILKEYQKNLLYAMKHLEENRHIKDSQEFETNFGIIADKTGSGKSISVLAHILNKPIVENKKNIQIDYKSSNDYLHLFDLKYNYEIYENTNLIVVNKILLKQWEKYIHQFTNITDYIVIKTIENVEKIVINKDIKIILVANNVYNNFTEKYKTICWSRVFFDDADFLNITNCNNIHANFIWLISSSIYNLCFPNKYYFGDNGWNRRVAGITNTGFIKDLLFSLLSLENISHLVFKNKDSYIKECSNIPEPNYKYCKADTPVEIQVLGNFVNKKIVQMINGNDYYGAMKELGFKVDSSKNIIKNYLDKLDTEKKDYNVSEIENKKNIIIDRLNNYDCCTICCEKIEFPVLLTCCNNYFDLDCIQKMLKYGLNECPLCRKHIDEKNNLIIIESAKKTDIITKEKIVIDLIKGKMSKPETLFLLFSDFDSSLEYLKEEFNKNGIKYNKLSGKQSEIDKSIEDARQYKYQVLLLNSKYYGFGLSLEFASDIIIYHQMNKELEKQIIGRGQRIGRETPLNVYYLYHDNEITIDDID